VWTVKIRFQHRLHKFLCWCSINKCNIFLHRIVELQRSAGLTEVYYHDSCLLIEWSFVSCLEVDVDSFLEFSTMRKKRSRTFPEGVRSHSTDVKYFILFGLPSLKIAKIHINHVSVDF
jgi:hypothetical protein